MSNREPDDPQGLSASLSVAFNQGKLAKLRMSGQKGINKKFTIYYVKRKLKLQLFINYYLFIYKTFRILDFPDRMIIIGMNGCGRMVYPCFYLAVISAVLSVYRYI